MGAAVVDFFVRLGIVLAFLVVGAIAYVGGDTAGAVGLATGAIVGGVLATFAYAPYLMATRNGQTVGHSAMGIRVVRDDGRPIEGGRAFLREGVVKTILLDGIGGFFLVPTLLNYLWPLWDDRNQALHDKLCSTLVVQA